MVNQAYIDNIDVAASDFIDYNKESVIFNCRYYNLARKPLPGLSESTYSVGIRNLEKATIGTSTITEAQPLERGLSLTLDSFVGGQTASLIHPDAIEKFLSLTKRDLTSLVGMTVTEYGSRDMVMAIGVPKEL